MSNLDIDAIETQEWLAALASVVKHSDRSRAQYIITQLLRHAYSLGVPLDNEAMISPYVNTIQCRDQANYPGNLALEQEIEALVRWNAIAMVLCAKHKVGELGGHLASYASIATLYEVGFNHFFRASIGGQAGDLVYFQGHSSEGNYARSYLEGRLTEEHLHNFRQEVNGNGLSSYPHPWLMPEFWQFATVSLGLGPLQAIYQARFMKYLQNRKLVLTEPRKVWMFCGDGEMDEPESLAGIVLAGREHLDNLIFVVNCNLQRLDGLVRGNGKIVNELEAQFRAAGWFIIKVLWDSNWDEIFAQDHDQLLAQRLATMVDGDLQNMHLLHDAEERRRFLAGDNDALYKLLASFPDDLICRLNRGAHDHHKVYAAYAQAMHNKGKPTVILAQGVKGYGLGADNGESRNVAHNHLSLSEEGLANFKMRFTLPLNQQELQEFNFYKPAADTPAMQYLHARRQALGGYLPSRQVKAAPLKIPDLDAFSAMLAGSGERDMSTTMALTRIMQVLFKDQAISERIVPIFSDEARTFGMESFFRQCGIYAPGGQLYHPEDHKLFLYYREASDGQVLQEGITEAGCISSWLAAATAYTNHQYPMIPFFVYYSMFGFQRVGDFIWAAADMRARGFLIGATAGRTTLQGEGLQHQDGHSLLSASAIPNCRAYDPAFAYEMAVIVREGLRVMYQEEQDVFYYIMAMNERYCHPPLPQLVQAAGVSVADAIIKGMYKLPVDGRVDTAAQVQLLGGGAILLEVLAAAKLLQEDFAISADVFSVTSFNELSRDGNTVERYNRLHPAAVPQDTYIKQCLSGCSGPIVAATDYIRLYAEQIRPFLDRPYYTLGTDGFGRSDTRPKLREFFEVDRYHIAFTALYALFRQGVIPLATVAEAQAKYKIDAGKPVPFKV